MTSPYPNTLQPIEKPKCNESFPYIYELHAPRIRSIHEGFFFPFIITSYLHITQRVNNLNFFVLKKISFLKISPINKINVFAARRLSS